jgi:hypothetical protein
MDVTVWVVWPLFPLSVSSELACSGFVGLDFFANRKHAPVGGDLIPRIWYQHVSGEIPSLSNPDTFASLDRHGVT